MSEATIPIKELMEKTEQWLLGQGYKKSTLGFYRATWNRFLSYSASPAYSRETAEQFLLQYFGVDVHAIDQTLDGRMRHARRHMNAWRANRIPLPSWQTEDALCTCDLVCSQCRAPYR